MNYTEKYHLPQWVKTDRIMMEDFNAAMTAIDSGLTGNAQAAAAAQSTADTARAEAAALPYVIGTYHGNGAASQDIVLGFRPRFVIVCSRKQAFVTPGSGGGGGVLMSGPSNLVHITMTDTGFRVANPSVNSGPLVNHESFSYDYIAFH